MVQQYTHGGQQGCRLPGWEQLNAARLAEDLQMSAQHIRQVLTGRTGAGLNTLKTLASCLDLTLDELIERIERAQSLDLVRRKHR